ncbi:MAG: hypothetical protein WC728_03340 [Elusimicrobiota bacterium]
MAEPEPRPESEPAAEPIPAPTPSREGAMARPSGKAFAVAAVLAVGLGAMALFKGAPPPQQPPEPAVVPQAPVLAEIPIDLVQTQPTGSGAAVQDLGDLVPYQESAQKELDRLAGGRAYAPKPQLRRIADIQPVAQRGDQGSFKTMHLIPNSSITQVSAGLPRCTRCGDGAVPYRRDPIAPSGGKAVGAAKFIGMCGGAYAYEITNRSGSGYRATFTSQNGEAWDVDLPPGGSTIIKSGNPLTGGLTGRQR